MILPDLRDRMEVYPRPLVQSQMSVGLRIHQDFHFPEVKGQPW